MNIPRLLTIIYSLALLPLVFSSAVFWLWYVRKTIYLEHTDMESWVVFSMIGWMLLGGIALFLVVTIAIGYKEHWRHAPIVVAILAFTFSVFMVYGRVESALRDKAYVRIVNDVPNTEVTRMRSVNFNRHLSIGSMQEEIVDFYPVVRYDWSKKDSSISYDYFERNPVQLHLAYDQDSVSILSIPQQWAGSCCTLYTSELVAGDPAEVNADLTP